MIPHNENTKQANYHRAHIVNFKQGLRLSSHCIFQVFLLPTTCNKFVATMLFLYAARQEEEIWFGMASWFSITYVLFSYIGSTHSRRMIIRSHLQFGLDACQTSISLPNLEIVSRRRSTLGYHMHRYTYVRCTYLQWTCTFYNLQCS